MINIIDTIATIPNLFDNGNFNKDKWRCYINGIYPNCSSLFEDDLNAYLSEGNYNYAKDILPIINNVLNHSFLTTTIESFKQVTNNLNNLIHKEFEYGVNADIILYLGLCNGAGWVTRINDKDVILLGIEKILELNWTSEDAMRGLIYHELGHLYHMQNGAFDQVGKDNVQTNIWQLFCEGIAMLFEQKLVHNINYYHQDCYGWLDWCNHHRRQILNDFYNDLPTMNRFNQRYFGDWVKYYGHSDVGYYLGAKFVLYLHETFYFSELINLSINEVCEAFYLYHKESNLTLKEVLCRK